MKFLSTLLIGLYTLKLSAGIGVGYSSEGALPVELTTFTANIIAGEVKLRWVTATEVRNYGFEIERAFIQTQNGETIWEKIGFINGHGNSNSPNEYSFTDNPQSVTKVNYRLKQIDTDGKYGYSSVVSIEIKFPAQYALNQNYPNPFNPSTVISYSLPVASNVTLKVYDVLGKLVTTLVEESQEAGSYSVNFDADGLSNGLYFYKIQSGNFVAVNKMLFLK